MRIATYNIKHGSLKGLDAVADALRPLEADLVALQEVDRGVSRSGGVDQPAVLARALGRTATFGPAFALEGGHYGVCLLSRFPVRSAQVHALPSAASVPLPDGVEPRIALEVRLAGLAVVIPHLGLSDAERLAQVEALLPRVGRERLVIAGDLNCGPGEAPFERLLAAGFLDALAGHADRATFPAGAPVLAIDHVLLSPDLPRPRALSVPGGRPPDPSARIDAHAADTHVDPSGTHASDHLPVVVDLW